MAGVVLLLVVILLASLLISDVQDGIQRNLYPLDYEGVIRSASAEYGVEPALVAAVIRTESEFDPEARSDQNAQGLMQIRPSTAETISRQSDIQGDFREPRVNIQMGAWYLDYLKDRYAGSERLTLTAYNAGEGNVDGWLEDESFDVRQDIPFPETASYVVEVREARDTYVELYGEDLSDG